MSDRFRIRQDESGLVRLFVVDTTAEPPLMSVEPDWDSDADEPPWPLRDALGADYLDADFIELFDVADLGEMGLVGYMTEGLGIARDQVTEDHTRLNALRGMVLVVTTRAFGGVAQTIEPRAPLRWIGTYAEHRTAPSSEILSSPGAAGQTDRPDAVPHPPQPPQTFLADRATYWREHAWIAAFAMALGMGVLWMMDNPHVWTGAVGGLFAVAVRAFYLASDEADAKWVLTETTLSGPDGRRIRLADIDRLRTLGSAVQIVTRSGDKHLMKYMADRPRVVAGIEAAMARAGNPA